MKNFFLDKKARVLELADIKHVAVWNSQLDFLLKAGGAQIEMFPTPAVFFEYHPDTIMQLGEGRQLYDPLDISVHILHWQLDAADGTFEQNLDVFELAQKVYGKLQKFKREWLTAPAYSDTATYAPFDRVLQAGNVYECNTPITVPEAFTPAHWDLIGVANDPNPAGFLIRISETHDYSHPGVYHFVQKYRTTYVDQQQEEPVDGVDGPNPPLELELDLTKQDSQDVNEPYVYHFTPA